MADNLHNDNSDFEKDAREYLNKIHRTISESEALIAQAERRMEETDRLLESQGLTRAQVEAMEFTDEQFDAVNAELKRRGMDPLDPMEINAVSSHTAKNSSAHGTSGTTARLEAGEADGDLENRRRKFNTMMGSFRL